MSITLLELSTGHLSLEFEEDDIPEVKEAIKTLFAKASQKKYGMASEVQFGETTFTFQNEWQDPCLISSSHEADQCLRQIHEKLTMK